MKVCIVSIAKLENLYISEWVNHHLNLGFDHIYICDNNDLDGERVSEVIDDPRVTIFDWIDEKSLQSRCYTWCYQKLKNDYDWVVFIDIDEFIILENDSDVHDFIQNPRFSDCNIIRLCWKHFTDNDELDVIDGDYSCLNRFNEQVTNFEENRWGKSFIKTTIDIKNNRIFAHGYFFDRHLTFAKSADGNKCINSSRSVVQKDPIYKNAWINHYRTKTIGEFIRQKYFRGCVSSFKLPRYQLSYFWKSNRWTQEKEDYAKKLIEEHDQPTKDTNNRT